MSDEIKVARETIGIAADLMKAAGNNPNVQEAGKNLGQAALTISKAINTALLPIAAVNFAFEKARIYFNGRFQQDLSERAAKIPPESIVEPKASIAGPTLQGLAFAHDEPSLRDMYLNLLATAMDDRVSRLAHPAFVEIIKQFDAEDAFFIQGILSSAGVMAIVQLHQTRIGEKGYQVIDTHLLDFRDASTGLPKEHENHAAMIDNWCRLGLTEVDYSRQVADDDAYSWVEQRPELHRLRGQLGVDKVVIVPQKGVLTRTNLGVRFATAVGLLAP